MLPLGVHPQRDRFAGPQCREQQVVGGRSGILASHAHGFICLKQVSPDGNVLQELRWRALNPYVRCQGVSPVDFVEVVRVFGGTLYKTATAWMGRRVASDA